MRKMLLATVLTAGLASTGHGAPFVTGDIVLSPAVPSLQGDQLASDLNMFLINEGAFSVSNLSVDIRGNAPGIYDQGADLTGAGGTVTGTFVSYILHGDSTPPDPAPPGGSVFYDGTITFDDNIIGILVRTATLNAADGCSNQADNPNPPGACTLDPINAEFAPSVFMRYANDGNRGLELGVGALDDRIEYISPNQIRVIQSHVTGSLDELRILVPEPATLALFGAGLLGLAIGLRRRRRGA